MCDLDKNFILCTCLSDDEPLLPPFWTLKKDNSRGHHPDSYWDEIKNVVGIFNPIPMEWENQTEEMLPIMRAVEKELNTRNCFDFRYTPQPNDVLTLKYPDFELFFKYIEYGESYIQGNKQEGSWVTADSPVEFFHMAKGNIETIPPEKQIKAPLDW